MDAIDRAFAEYKTAVNGFEAATRRMRDAKVALLRALDMWPAGDVQVATPRPTPAPKPVPPAKAPQVARATATPAAWNADTARRLADALDGYGSVVGQIIGAGGSVPVDRMPSASDAGGFLALSGVPAACCAIRAKARKRGFPDTFISERSGRVVIDPGLVAAWRQWMEPGGVPRAHRSAINVEADA